MPSPSFLLGFSSILASALATQYSQQEVYTGKNWLDAFHFTTQDFNNGFVDYVSEAVAKDTGLYKVVGDDVMFGVDAKETLDYTKATGRKSVKLEGNRNYNKGLFILDVKAMPGVCGMWPAFWSLGEEPWPVKGEIDIIEGVNSATHNKMNLHTSTSCTTTGLAQSGVQLNRDCALDTAGTLGCDVDDTRPASFGSTSRGGYYAMEWAADAINIWFFPRDSKLPASLTSSAPDTADFGVPAAHFAGACDIESRFKDQRFIFTNNFCGDWAGNAYQDSGCPMQKDAAGKALGAVESCRKYVANHPEAFEGQFWRLGSFKTFVKKTVVSSSVESSSMARTSSSSRVSSSVASSRVSSSASSARVSLSTSSTKVISSSAKTSFSATSSRASSFALSTKVSSSASSTKASSSVSSTKSSSSTSSTKISSSASSSKVSSFGSSTKSSSPASSTKASTSSISSTTISSLASKSTASSLPTSSLKISSSASSPTVGSSSARVSTIASVSPSIHLAHVSLVPDIHTPAAASFQLYPSGQSSLTVYPSSSPASIHYPGNSSAPVSYPVPTYNATSSLSIYRANAKSTPCTTSSTPLAYANSAAYSYNSAPKSAAKNDYPALPSFTPLHPLTTPHAAHDAKVPVTTTYTSTYADVCETGYTTRTTTFAVTHHPLPTPASGKPSSPQIGWDVTTKLCASGCAAGPTTVTVTLPCTQCDYATDSTTTTRVYQTKMITLSKLPAPESVYRAASSAAVSPSAVKPVASQSANSAPMVPAKPSSPVYSAGGENGTASMSVGTGGGAAPSMIGGVPPVFTGAASALRGGGLVMAGVVAAMVM